jgi:hypothetical protein
MKNSKVLLALVSAFFLSSAFVALTAILQNTATNFVWLINQGFEVSIPIFLDSYLHDVRGGTLFYLIILATLFVAFSVAALLRLIIPLSGHLSYALAGFFSLYAMINLTLYFFDGIAVIASLRNGFGFLTFCFFGMLGGYIFETLKNIFLGEYPR